LAQKREAEPCWWFPVFMNRRRFGVEFCHRFVSRRVSGSGRRPTTEIDNRTMA
jgi:hypothetical protein